MRALALLIALLVVLSTSESARASEPPCDPQKRECGCERNWGCWNLLYTSPGTVLGIKGTATLLHGARHAAADGGMLTTYFTEHYGTRHALSAHFQAFGAIGGGSAGTEGGVGGALDVGWRGSVTKVSGPFVRGGASGLLLGHQRMYLSMFEPLQARAGYQVLDGDLLLEWGATTGLIMAGRYDPGEQGARSLSRALSLGAYSALHFADLRVDASFVHLFAEPTLPHTDLNLARLAFCSYPRPLALCADALLVHGDATLGHASGQRSYRAVRSLYMGLTVGMTP